MSELAEYETQLAAVEQALLSNTNEQELTVLTALKNDLLEVIKLLKDDSVNEDKTSTHSDEMARFQREIDQLEATGENTNETVTTETTHEKHTNEEDLATQVQELKAELEKLVGQKCSAPHQHAWGAVTYHNAMVCGVEDVVDLGVRVRVLFMNPTHREMLPCNYYLDGECRFDENHCHYSHGELVSPLDVREYVEPNFERLTRNCVVLAKLKDRLWHRGRVLCTNFIEKNCRVRLDGKEHKEREKDFEFQDLFPIFHDEDLSSGSSSSEDDEKTESEELDELEEMQRARLIEQCLFAYKPTQALGEWEQYTRGIGSKLMAKMGYITGTGLGSDGRGIVVPVSAQILPQGRSLDHCMELREAANGDKDLFSVEKKLLREKKKQAALNAKAYERDTQRVDVFSFLNENILTPSGKDKETTEVQKSTQKQKTNLQQHTNKSLNVESMRVADDIRRKEREIGKVKESLRRNAIGSDVHKRLQVQLNARNQELQVLKCEEKNLSKEQATRKTKHKLCVF